MDTLDRGEVTRRVQEIVGETLRRSPSEIGLDARLQEDLGAESLDIMTLVFELEDTFGRTLEDDEIRRLTTARSVVDFLLGDHDTLDGLDPLDSREAAADV